MTATATVKRPEAHSTPSPPAVPQPSRSAAPSIALRRLLLFAAVLSGGLAAAAWYVIANDHPVEPRLELQGNIDVRQVNLAFKVEGRIETLAVDEGDSVTAGQVIATLDKRDFADELQLARARRDNAAANLARLLHGSRPEEITEAKAELGQRQATLDLAKANLALRRTARFRRRNQQGRSRRSAAKPFRRATPTSITPRPRLRLAVIGPRREDIDASRALLGQQEAMLVQSERRLADADLVAPSDGIILTRARERGAILQPGETVFTLTLARPVWVRTYVSDANLGLIHPDLPARVTTDSAPGRPYSGRVGFISPTAEFTPKTVETRELRTNLVYRLRVVIDRPDGGLRQGMPVTVAFDVNRPLARTLWQRIRDALPRSVRGAM